MSSVPDFSQAPAAAAVERVTPPGGEPVVADGAEAGTADRTTTDPDDEPGT